MSLSPAAVFDLAERCAPAVAAQTLSAVASAESAFNPLAINVNHALQLARPPASRAEAVAVARTLQIAGANFDLGLLQINVSNLRRLGLSLEDAFDPCRNLAAGAALLRANYAAAQATGPDPQAALRAALSRYNTGDDTRGFRNGYVTRVVSAAARLDSAGSAPSPVTPPIKPAAWDAFGDLRAAGFVVSLPPTNQGPTP
ncbi:MAG: lytic transglycosylase domain-containing protein [Phenylobacterium sp.]